MVKDKLKHQLAPTSNPDMGTLINSNPGYTVYRNIVLRNLLSIYEKVPMESLRVSENYSRATEEN